MVWEHFQKISNAWAALETSIRDAIRACCLQGFCQAIIVGAGERLLVTFSWHSVSL